MTSTPKRDYRTKHVWPCAKCGAHFRLNSLQAARIRADNEAAVFCSRACAGVTLAAHIDCLQCGKSFYPSESQRTRLRQDPKARVFCSRACYGKSKEL